ncbi:MAG: alpha/beta fold hydrolase [Alphaproteobacteria bacterium]|nr:alpha/beta fold hydrolase [Alphaproteobacteria bacterium]
MNRKPFLLSLMLMLGVAAGSAAAAEQHFPGETEGNYIVHNFRFEDGQTLPELRLHYTTLGHLKRDAEGHATNAILILHGTGGTGHQFFSPQFADVLFRPGGLLDPAKYYIILPDDIGHGKSSKPSDGLRAHFPHYDYADMVRAEHILVTKALGVDHLRVVMGTSMGCMHSFMWGERYPDAMDGLLPLACEPVPIAGRNRLWREMILNGIRNDPAYDHGNYKHEPEMALRLAADMLRIAVSAPIQDQILMPTAAAADAYLRSYLAGELSKLDANDLYYQVASSHGYNPEPDLGKIKARLIWINSADDFINPPDLGIPQREIKRIPHGTYVLIPASDKTHGHSTHTWAAVWQGWLAKLLAETAH